MEIDKIDSLVPTLSPSQKEWLNKEMGKTTSPERWSSAAKSKEFALKHARQYITSIKSILDAFETAPHDKEFIIWVSLAYSLLNYGDFDLGLCVKKVIKNCPFPYTIRKGLIVSDLELAATQDAKVIIMGVLGPKFGTGFSK